MKIWNLKLLVTRIMAQCFSTSFSPDGKKRLRPLLPRPPAGTTILQSAGITGGTLQLIAVTQSGVESSKTESDSPELASEKSLQSMDERLRVLLPPGYLYKLVEFKSDDVENRNSFSAVLRINITSAESARRWLREFSNSSQCDFTIVRSTKCVGHFKRFGQIMKCHRNVQRGKIGRGKHCACPARLMLSVRALPGKARRTRPRDHAFLAQLALVWRHNHPVLGIEGEEGGSGVDKKSVERLRARTVDLYRHGHLPTTAHAVLEMEEEFGRELLDEMDGLFAPDSGVGYQTHIPDLKTCYYYYYKYFKSVEEVGSREEGVGITEGEGGRQRLQSVVDLLSKGCGPRSVVATQNGSGRWNVAICTPFMKRVHELVPESGLRVFLDSTPEFSSDGYKVFFFMCLSACGALPLGVAILPSESATCITEGFRLLATLLPEGKAFYGRANAGPYCFVTDDSAPEVVALTEVWPSSQIFFSEFYILQALWRWLHDTKHFIEEMDRVTLFRTIKQWFLAQTEEELLLMIQRLTQDGIALKYQHFINHAMALAERRTLWAPLYRLVAFNVSGSSTQISTTAAEASMRLIKERLFERTRAFDIVQMTDFIVSELSRFHAARLLDASRNRLRSMTRLSRLEPRRVEEIVKISQEMYAVSGNSIYDLSDVDTLACMCTCGEGQREGLACKHLLWVVTAEEIDSFTLTPRGTAVRTSWYQLATGTEPPEGWMSSSADETEDQPPIFIFDMPQVESACDSSGSSVAAPSTSVSQDTSADARNLLLVSKLIEDIQQSIRKTVTSALQENPEEVLEPLEQFRDSLSGLRTQMSIIRALRSFGRMASIARSRGRRSRVSSDLSAKAVAIAKRKRKNIGSNCAGTMTTLASVPSASSSMTYLTAAAASSMTYLTAAAASSLTDLTAAGASAALISLQASSAAAGGLGLTAGVVPPAGPLMTSSLSSFVVPTVVPASFMSPTFGTYVVPTIAPISALETDVTTRTSTSVQSQISNFDGFLQAYLPLL